MAAIIYARQSDVTNDKRTGDDAETLSLEAQATACRAFAERKGWHVSASYSWSFANRWATAIK